MDTTKSTTTTDQITETSNHATETPGRTRGLHRGTGGHKPTCQCAFCKAARYTQLTVSNNHNAAEVVRLAESLRLVEQGRDEAIRGREAGLEQIKKLQEELTLAHRTSEGYKATIADLRSEAYQLSATLDHANADKVQLQLLREEALLGARSATFEGTLQTIVASVLVAVAAFLVGRWAR